MSPGPHDPVRRRLIAALGMASVPALVALPACAPSGTFRVAVTPGFGAMSLLAAREQHLLDGHRTQLTPMIGRAALQALRDGRVDGAALGLEEAVLLNATGLPVTVVAVCDISVGGDALIVRPGFVLGAAPVGSRVATDDTLRSSTVLSMALRRAGLAPSGIRKTPMPPDPVSALAGGRVDAVVTRMGATVAFRDAGMEAQFDTRTPPRHFMDVMVVRTDALERHATSTRHLLRVHFATLREWRQNPVDANPRLSALLGVAPEDVAFVAAGFQLPDERANLELLSAPAGVLLRAARACESMLREGGLLPDTSAPPLRVVPEYLPL